MSVSPLSSIRVIKLGGSLFDLVDLKLRFDQWLDAQPPALNLLVAGGGPFVEALRKLDLVHAFSDSFNHWLAVDLMHDTARLVASVLDRPMIATQPLLLDLLSASCINTSTYNGIPFPSVTGVWVVQPSAYYSPQLVELAEQPLPETWDCTSDSLAAYLARCTQASELVLLKSTMLFGERELVVEPANLMQLANLGVVDGVFPTVADTLGRVRLVNLRAPD